MAERTGDLRDLLCVLPSWPRSRVRELAPAFWQQTREHEDAQQRLAANVFRAVTLADHASPVDDAKNPTVDFHGEKRGNETHASTTDPEARLARKARKRSCRTRGTFCWRTATG